METQPLSITPKVALLTGASRSPGPGIARSLAARGWRIAINDLTPILLDNLAEEINKAGGQACPHVADVSQKLALQTILNDIEDEWGHIDLLINNTRVMPNMPLLEMDEWDWRHTVDVNLTGAFLLTQVVGRMMRARRGGTIIHLLQPDEAEGHAAYAATQAGLEGMVRVAEKELQPFSIQIHIATLGVIAPDDIFQILSSLNVQAINREKL